MKPEASFDVLYILDRLREVFPDVHFMELNSLIYLAYVLAIYDGKTSENWRYQFAQHKFGGPYAEELADTVEFLKSSGYLREKNGRISFTEASALMLNINKNLHSLGWREKYLAATSDAVMSRQLPTAVHAIQREPMLAQASSANWRSMLGVGSFLDALYEQIAALHDALGKKSEDIWIAALTWLDYWKAIGDVEVSSDGN